MLCIFNIFTSVSVTISRSYDIYFKLVPHQFDIKYGLLFKFSLYI